MQRSRTLTLVAILVLGTASMVVFAVTRNMCLSAWWQYDLSVRRCPVGKIRQTTEVAADGLQRGAPGTIEVASTAHYTTNSSDQELREPIDVTSAKVELVDAADQAQPITLENADLDGMEIRGRLVLPEVPDGDYKVRVRASTALGEDVVDVPLALYAPAKVHVITDRPLYEPGNTVRFRAVVLRARDLAPLDGRPGTWMIQDPQGEVLLEEKAPTGEWGVVAGSFPLDRGAASGAWRVRWVSGGAADEVSFTVEPFTLPRFRVEAETSAPFYRPREKPVIAGQVVYSSGAPVAAATVEVKWSFSGDWPPPTAWLEGGLPQRVQTGGDGRFELAMPAVPDDLLDQVKVTAQLSAVDPAGDRVEGAASVLFSQDSIQVSAVTELADGLVEGFNNRVYLRVTTADGRPLPGAKVNVRRAWAPADLGMDMVLDEDSVGTVQLDPGPAVNVVVPAMPVRLPPRQRPATRGELFDMLAQDEASLADQVAMDGWLAELAGCAKYFDPEDSNSVELALRVEASGALSQVVAGQKRALDRCTTGVVATRRLPAARDRLYTVEFDFNDPDFAHVTPSNEVAVGGSEEVAALIADVARGTRDCIPADVSDEALPRALIWRVRAGAREVQTFWVRDPNGLATHTAMRCLETAAFSRLVLDDPAEQDGMGLVRFDIEPSERQMMEKPQPTVMLGYELLVKAEDAKQPLGTTRLRMTPGSVPDVRLRATPVLAKKGEKVNVELLRGPSFKGELPKELELVHLKGRLEAPLDPKTRSAEFTLDQAIEGWAEVTGLGARTLVYVRPDADLSVALTTEKPRYAPGDEARLAVVTTIGGKGAKAAVGLFGVDASLGQIAALRGADDLGRVRPMATMSSPAFGTLDAQALALGRIRGAHAAAATILRVSAIPPAPELEAVVSGRGATTFDPVAELTDSFYFVLDELHLQVREWEASAPKDELMHPPTMARLWQAALDAAAKKGHPTVDAYGRRLRLSRLPSDLLALTDPRVVVVDGARLPEDVESWDGWVEEEQP